MSSAADTSSGSGVVTRGATLVSSATRPSLVARVLTLTNPTEVWKISSAAGDRSASAMAEAIVACPQNGTSSSGEK